MLPIRVEGTDFGYVDNDTASLPAIVTVKLLLPENLRISARSGSSLTLEWDQVNGADGYEVRHVVEGASATCGEVADITVSGLEHRFSPLNDSTSYLLCVRATLTEYPDATSDWASATSSTHAAPPPAPAFVIRGSVSPDRCLTGGSVTVGWKVTGGSGSVVVKIGSRTVTGGSEPIACKSSAGSQSLTLTATATGPPEQEDTDTVSWTVDARSGWDCLTVQALSTNTNWRDDCASTTAANLWTALSGRNVCALWSWDGTQWQRYAIRDGILVPGSTDFTINAGGSLWLSRCTSDGEAESGPTGPPPLSS